MPGQSWIDDTLTVLDGADANLRALADVEQTMGKRDGERHGAARQSGRRAEAEAAGHPNAVLRRFRKRASTISRRRLGLCPMSGSIWNGA